MVSQWILSRRGSLNLNNKISVHAGLDVKSVCIGRLTQSVRPFPGAREPGQSDLDIMPDQTPVGEGAYSSFRAAVHHRPLQEFQRGGSSCSVRFSGCSWSEPQSQRLSNSAQVHSSRRPSPPPSIRSPLRSTIARPTHAGGSLNSLHFSPSSPPTSFPFFVLFDLPSRPPSIFLPSPTCRHSRARRRPECLRPRNVRWRFLTAAAHPPEHEARLDTVAPDAKPRATTLSYPYCDHYHPRQASLSRGASSLRRSGCF